MTRAIAVSAVLCLALACCTCLRASVVTESEPNDYYTQAQSVGGHFSLDYRADIDTLAVRNPDTTWTITQTNTSTFAPHATVEATGDGTCDFFAFSGLAGQTAIIDMDYTSPGVLGAKMTVWYSGYGSYGGEYIAASSSTPNVAYDTGTTLSTDPFLPIELPETGVYYIGVSDITAVAYSWTPTYYTRVGVKDGGEYIIHISLIPEPGTVLLLTWGLAALAVRGRRRRA